MRKTSSTQLTSSELTNKIILANSQYDDMMTLHSEIFNEYEMRCMDIVLDEFAMQQLTLEECFFVFDHVFKLCEKINDLDLTTSDSLINLGYCLDQFAIHPNRDVREYVACKGRCLDVLVNDEDCEVRQQVAKHFYQPEKLMHDHSLIVKRELVKQHYRLDHFVQDKVYLMRSFVADAQYGLSKLISDPISQVRKTVAEKNYRLDLLINDPSDNVRIAVAAQGYGLCKLVNDKSYEVQRVAQSILRRMNRGNTNERSES